MPPAIGNYEIYPREKIFDPRNTHEKKALDPRNTHKGTWHDGSRPTRPAMAHDPRNLAHSILTSLILRACQLIYLKEQGVFDFISTGQSQPIFFTTEAATGNVL